MEEIVVDNMIIQKIVSEYGNMVFQIAYQNVFNYSDAEDITQETFIKLIEVKKKFESEEHIKAWLIRVVINLCKNHKKSFWQRKTDPLIDSLYAFTSEQEEIMEELSYLSPKYRNVIYLYYYQEYSIPEIAKLMDASLNTISSQLQRARKNLKILIERGANYE